MHPCALAPCFILASCVYHQNLNMDMVGAEALAALFGVYGDVVKIKMIPHGESALIQVNSHSRICRCKTWDERVRV